MPRYVVALFVALAALPACLPEITDDDSIPNFNPERTVMGVIQEEGVLRIAVEDDRPPWSDATGGGAPEGFTVELGRLVSRSLGVTPEFSTATAEEMFTALEDGDLDIAFPLAPITEERLGSVAFADPYWVGHQRLLVPDGSPIEQVADLDERTVCPVVHEDTGIPPSDLHPAIGPDSVFLPALEGPIDPLGCLAPLRFGDVESVMGPDVLLITYMDELGAGYSLVGDDLTTEGYGPAVAPGLGGFTSFIDSVLGEADREGVWRDHYDRWIAPVTGVEMEFPRITAEDAAAIYPSR